MLRRLTLEVKFGEFGHRSGQGRFSRTTRRGDGEPRSGDRRSGRSSHPCATSTPPSAAHFPKRTSVGSRIVPCICSNEVRDPLISLLSEFGCLPSVQQAFVVARRLPARLGPPRGASRGAVKLFFSACDCVSVHPLVQVIDQGFADFGMTACAIRVASSRVKAAAL